MKKIKRLPGLFALLITVLLSVASGGGGDDDVTPMDPPDAGTVQPDAGTPMVDAGSLTPPDAGQGLPDAGTSSHDAGPAPMDAGHAPTDAGPSLEDAGPLPNDAGAPSPDAGSDDPPLPASCGDGLCTIQTECGICSDCDFLVSCDPSCANGECAWCGDGRCHDTLENCGCSKDCGFCFEEIEPEIESILHLVNDLRENGANCGIYGDQPPAPPLILENILGHVATAYSARMATEDFFAHVAPDGSDPQSRVENSPYVGSFRGENLAGGYLDAAAVVDGWLHSDGHCRVMLHPGASEMGLGYAFDATSTYRHYWTMVLGNQ